MVWNSRVALEISQVIPSNRRQTVPTQGMTNPYFASPVAGLLFFPNNHEDEPLLCHNLRIDLKCIFESSQSQPGHIIRVEEKGDLDLVHRLLSDGGCRCVRQRCRNALQAIIRCQSSVSASSSSKRVAKLIYGISCALHYLHKSAFERFQDSCRNETGVVVGALMSAPLSRSDVPYGPPTPSSVSFP
jgi:hypothetical protein